MKKLIYNNIYTLLYILIAFVYILGLFIPLIENDSAQHAVMAMRMYLLDDYTHLYRGIDNYLDKPHMHFWLAALSYKIFGLNQFAYRIPALLFTIIGAFSCFKLFQDLYKNKNQAHWAALIFLSAQAIILGNHDVRTDAVLTGAVILSLWQLYRFLNTQKLLPLIIGAFAMGIAFSCKGLLGLVVIGLSLISHLIYTKNWKALLTPKLLIGVFVFGATIAPVLYAFYVQYDLHPETTVNGINNISGIKFILWDQSFNRMTANGFKPDSPDYFFFFHTILWVFLPWPLLFYAGLFKRFRFYKKTTESAPYPIEWLTLGGIILTLIIISFSQTKLPHYLNSLMPTMAVFTAGYLYILKLQEKTKTLKIVLYTSYFVLGVGVVGVTGLLFFTFDFPAWYILLAEVIVLTIIYMFITNKEVILSKKIIVITVLTSVLINITLNGYFYQNLLHYQSGKYMAEYIHEQLNDEQVYIVDKEYRWSLDYYSKQLVPNITIDELKHINTPKLIATNHPEEIDEFISSTNLQTSIIKSFDDFRITRVSLKFLNPRTREKQVGKAYLLKVYPKKQL
ncbi:dolichyl-phosphate-mannose--protein mannosyltransferase [Neptunitalea chrysea]|uniref:Dolichyl-phosphate-mannose--protein mannosyltransferase n=1 Tax=Neptunitalea chrysea TaxID=1647581 RepID=A0A9W6EVN7_9FLAO|nr:glycosyltransferase family 39 protein [Neptunitalea chrysea]GLB54049.1 dolichyl-phosphate-mannose--protein mannosyltransferase [Neptunitalea chrysea]